MSALQRERDHVADRGFVFDDQNAFVHAGFRGSPVTRLLLRHNMTNS
jgi:hypothetical protein